MKRYILIVAAVFLMMGCESVLDIKPTNMISSEDVKNDPALVDAFLTKIFNSVRWQTGAPNEAMATLAVCGGEHTVFAGWQNPFKAAMHIMDEIGAHSLLDYWPYGNIRSANEILEILEESDFDDSFVVSRMAEARFLRAFMYFELVKRYGGVPLITIPQSIDQPIEELMVPRNSEQEIYDFIAAELDEIAPDLPEGYSNDAFGRPTKWAAIALKSRAMLYAGSIGEYATVQLNGILGIPDGPTSYWQAAYDASMDIINNSSHSLYNENADPAENYAEIFLNDANSEVIFAEVYNLGLLKTHGWNFYNMPDGFRTGWGSNGPVYLEHVERYEMMDGSSGKFNWDDLNDQVMFDNNEIMHNRDPRFRASVFYPETPWQDSKVYLHKNTTGTIDPASGWPKVAPARNYKKSGFLTRKRVNESIKLPISQEDESDWIVFRLAEMYLNAAEAAFHLGNSGEALSLVNAIRERAGMPAKSSIDFETIKNERAVELAFEEHRYWDIRRWRTAVEELEGKGFHGVDWIYHFDEQKYTLKLKDADYKQIRVFAERNYYLPLGINRLADNTNLVENPGY
ncbi:MAG: RagB/SusD family nutrient uptake outer membrane protein [Bacteroidetes bacterium]|nr:RagB/SusD family nutrient uptake outer membrane protein [Bacteroidota bacterium]